MIFLIYFQLIYHCFFMPMSAWPRNSWRQYMLTVAATKFLSLKLP